MFRSLAKKHLTLRRSRLHGRGLFAARPLRAGQWLGDFIGARARHDGRHVLWVDDKPLRVTNALRFVNHARPANARIVVGRAPHLHAARPIRRGEEILIDYGEDWP